MPRMTHAGYLAYMSRVEGLRQRGVCTYPSSRPAEKESDLHDQVIAECKRLGWLWIHARMDKASHMTVGAPDFVILADGGRLLLVECKTRTGKVRPEQAAFAAWAGKLGHVVHIVRSLEEFCALKKFGAECNTLGGETNMYSPG